MMPGSPPSPNRPQRSSVTRSRLAWVGTLSLLAVLAVAVAVSLGQSRAEATGPKLNVQPTVVAGAQLTVVGSGFTPFAHVELRWQAPDAEVTAIHADASGRFAIVLTIPPGTGPGVHTLAATEHGDSPGDARDVSATVRVVPAISELDPEVDHHGAPEPSTSPRPTRTEELMVVRVPPSAVADAGEHDHADSPADAGTSATTQPPPEPTGDHGHPPTPPPTPAPNTPPPSDGHHPPTAGDPISCTGYPEPRTFLEVHAWWEGRPLAAGQIAHLHAGTCFPLGQTVSGQVVLDVRIVMHDNPGHLFRYETSLHTEDEGEGDLPVVGLDHRCSGTCEFWVRTVIDTSGAHDGWHEVRFKPRVRFSDGSVQFTSSGWPLRTANGNPVGNVSSGTPDVVGRGWFEDHGYQNPVLRSVDAVLPGRTISGVWRPTLRLDAGSGGSTPTFTAAYLNPDFHHHDEDSDGAGIVLGKWNGPFRGELGIDTRGLPNGHYTLVLRVEHKSGGSRVTGLQYVPIMVQN
jgi:hypothetical protein